MKEVLYEVRCLKSTEEYISRINTLFLQQDKLKCKNYEAQAKLSVFLLFFFLQKVVQ